MVWARSANSKPGAERLQYNSDGKHGLVCLSTTFQEIWGGGGEHRFIGGFTATHFQGGCCLISNIDLDGCFSSVNIQHFLTS